MIERFSESVALRIKNINPEETASVAVMKFALIGLINNSLTFLLIFLIGALAGTFVESVIAAFSFMAVRLFAGGFHFSKPWLCIVVSTVSLSAVPLLAKYASASAVFWLTLTSFVITLLFAPSNIKKTRIKKTWHPIYKLIAAAMVGANFLIQSPVLALTFLIQAISTIDINGRSVNDEKTG